MADTISEVAEGTRQGTEGLADNIKSTMESAVENMKEAFAGISLKGVGDNSEEERKKEAKEMSGSKDEPTPAYFQELIQTVLQFQENYISNIAFDREGRLTQTNKEDSQKAAEEAAKAEKEAKEEAEKKPENIIVDGNADVTGLAGNIGIVSVTASGFGILTGSVREINKTLQALGAKITAGQAGLHRETAKLTTAKEKKDSGDKSNGVGATLGAIFHGAAQGVMAIGGALIVLGAGLFVIGSIDKDVLAQGMSVIGTVVVIVGSLLLLQSLMQNHIEKFHTKDKDSQKNIHYGVEALVGVFLAFALFATIALGIKALGLETVMGAVLGTLAILAVSIIGLAVIVGIAEAISGEGLANLKGIMFAFIGIVLVTTLLVVIGTLVPAAALDQGFNFTFRIMALAFGGLLAIIGLSVIASRLGGKGTLKNLNEIMKAYIGLMLVVTLLVLLLGGALAFLPITQEHLDAGMKNTGIIMGIAIGGLLLVGVIAKIIGKDTLNAVKGLMLAYTGLLLVLTGMVILLGNTKQEVLVKGFIATVSIMALATLGIFLASKLASNTSTVLKALLGLAVSAVILLAIGGLAILLGTVVPDVGSVVQGGLSVLVTLGFMVGIFIACAALGFAMMAAFGGAAIGLAFIALASMALLTLAIAGVAVIMHKASSTIGGPTGAANTGLALLTAIGMFTALALASIIFAVLAIPVAIALPFALIGLAAVGYFAEKVAETLKKSVGKLQGINPQLILAFAVGVNAVLACGAMMLFFSSRSLSMYLAKKKATKALDYIVGFASSIGYTLSLIGKIAATAAATAATVLPGFVVAIGLITEAAQSIEDAVPTFESFLIKTGQISMFLLGLRFAAIAWFLNRFTQHAWNSYGNSIKAFADCIKAVPEAGDVDKFIEFLGKISNAGDNFSYWSIQKTSYALSKLGKGMASLAWSAGPMRQLAEAMREVAAASQAIADIQGSVENTVTPDVNEFRTQAEDSVVSAIHSVTARLAGQALQIQILNRIAEAQEETKDMLQQIALAVEFGNGGSNSSSSSSSSDGEDGGYDMSSGNDYV